MYVNKNLEFIISSHYVEIVYDCDGGFERCGKLWILKYKDAQKNFEKNDDKHICRPCWLKNNNPAKRKEVQDKMKQTNLERYGATTALNSKENIAARVEQMFGTEEAVKEIVKKRRKTNLERYGSDHPMQNDEIKAKQKAVLTEKYGTHVPLQNEEIKAKMQKTVHDRYGVTNVAMLPEVRAKMAKTMYENYGVEHYNQLPEMKDYLRDNCTEWLADSYTAGGPNKGVPRPESWSLKQSHTMTEKILKGEFNPEDSRFYVTGYYRSQKCKNPKAFFRSSLELMMHYLLDIDPKILWYENEPFAISYEKAPGVVRNYIPDFFAFRKGDKPLLLEIKPAFRMREAEVGYKVEAGKKFCEENGFEFVYVDEKFLKANSLSLDELRILEHVEVIKPKK
jgi:hypothetical protein